MAGVAILNDDFRVERSEDEPAFIVDVEGFEGPLDLLLELARQQKVDLAKISILALAEQYLAFIEAARKLRLELAADYLVMAAWLAYLKSRLLLPGAARRPKRRAAEIGRCAGAAAASARSRSASVAEQLLNRPQLGRDFFARGQPEPIAEITAAGLDGEPLRSAVRLRDARRRRTRAPSCACRRAPSGRSPRRAKR